MLEGFAYLAAHQNNPERALTLAGAASSLRQIIGAPPRPGQQAKLDAALKTAWKTGLRGRQSHLDDRVENAARRGHPVRSGPLAVKARDVYSKLAGSTIRRTAATRSTGKPPIRPCSRINVSSEA